MADDAEKGLSEAHTWRDPIEGAPIGDQAAPADDLGAAVAQLAGQLGDQGEQFDLLGDPPAPVDTLESLADKSSAERRARGRPAGSTNKRNTQVFDYLEHIGHRDPVMTLSLFQTMDLRELAAMLGCKMKDAAALQISAAEKLLPYKYAKRPTELHVQGDGSRRPVMVIGEMNVQLGGLSDEGFMTAGQPRSKTIDNQEVSEGESVRHDDDVPHETVKPLKTQD